MSQLSYGFHLNIEQPLIINIQDLMSFVFNLQIFHQNLIPKLKHGYCAGNFQYPTYQL